MSARITACCLTAALALSLSAQANTTIDINDGQSLTQADTNISYDVTGSTVTGTLNGQTFTFGPDLTINVNNNGVLGPLKDQGPPPPPFNETIPDLNGFDLKSTTININDGGTFLSIANYAQNFVDKSTVTNAIISITPGGLIRSSFTAENNTHITNNGGLISSELTLNNATLTLNAGTIREDNKAYGNSQIMLNGGVLADNNDSAFYLANQSVLINNGAAVEGRLSAGGNATINMNAGVNTGYISLEHNARLNLSGGILGGGVRLNDDSTTNITGTDFRLDGTPITSLPDNHLQPNQILTFTLEDGTPTIVANSLTSYVDARSAINLINTNLPAIDTNPITVNSGPTQLRGLRPGQTLNLSDTGSLPEYFSAIDAEINMSGGQIESGFEAVDTTINMSAGNGRGLRRLYRGTTLNLTGGTVGSVILTDQSTINMSGGDIAGLAAEEGSTFNMHGGHLGRSFAAEAGSEVHITAGTVENQLFGGQGSDVRIYGGEFYLDGKPFPGLHALELDRFGRIDHGQVLTATLTDGNVIRIGGYPDALTLVPANIPQISDERRIITGTNGQNYYGGIRPHESVIVTGNAIIPNGMHLIDADLHVESGDIANMTAYRSTITIDLAQLHSIKAYEGTAINFKDVEIAGNLELFDDSEVTVHSGNLNTITVNDNATADILGGNLDRILVNGSAASIHETVRVNVLHAGAGTVIIEEAAYVNVLRAHTSAEITALGATINVLQLTDSHADLTDVTGSSFEFVRSTATLNNVTVTPIPRTASNITDSDITIHSGQYSQLIINGSSEVTITDGIFGSSQEVTDNAKVHISGGTFGRGFNAEGDSTVFVTGGNFGTRFQARSNVTLAGGTFEPDFDSLSSSNLTLAGGEFLGAFRAFAGSTNTLFLTNLTVDGTEITLLPGEAFTITQRDVTLEAILADVTPLTLDLVPDFNSGSDYIDPNALLRAIHVIDGDTNFDNAVNMMDLSTLSANFGRTNASRAHGDFNGDNSVDLIDLSMFAKNFGFTGPIPEPTTAALLAFASLFVTRRTK
ncbi:dockerin type I domain-containing protein [Mucisphaera sp.]|uniref:dockerin type I domain-containing protein n=1 Tax=Mucisphaera sp. TaxID=2913024 RepID=UPI003D0A7BE5